MGRSKTEVRVSVICALNAQGFQLWGKRLDNDKFTTPAGHVERGETPLEGAKRELWEEAGLQSDKWEFLGQGTVEKDGETLLVYCYQAEIAPGSAPTSKNDPDHEVEEWKWISPIGGLPDIVMENLHAKDNVLLKLLGLQKGEVKKSELPPVSELLMKSAVAMASPAPMVQASLPSGGTSEQVPAESNSWSPTGLHPDLHPIAQLESSFGKNMRHAKNRRGDYYTAFGPVGLKPVVVHEMYKKSARLKHDYPGLEDPDKFMEKFHSDWGMYNTLASEHWRSLARTHELPWAVYAWRHGPGAAKLATHDQVATDPYVQQYLAMRTGRGMVAKSEDLAKAQHPDHFKGIKRDLDPSGASLVDPSMHLNQPLHKELADSYKTKIQQPKKIVKKQTARTGGISKKVIYHEPQKPGEAGEDEFGRPYWKAPNRFMVKPYHEKSIGRTESWTRHPHQGWAEMANQALYHAAGIGHLHQKVFVAEHDMGTAESKDGKIIEHKREPALVIAMSPSQMATIRADSDAERQVIREDARKIGIMDFLTNNLDRHMGNYLVQGNGHLLALDHSRSFQYLRPNNASKWTDDRKIKFMRQQGMSFKGQPPDEDQVGYYIFGSKGHNIGRNILPELDIERDRDNQVQNVERFEPTVAWWGKNSEAVKNEMKRQLEAIKDPAIRAHIWRNFNARAKVLDQFHQFGLDNHGLDWYNTAAPIYKVGEKEPGED